MHHFHALAAVRDGAYTLSTPINVRPGVASSCPGNGVSVVYPLTTVLQKMMMDSNNPCTQAIDDEFGRANLNNTATGLGMLRTSLNHMIGCYFPALNTPNQTTLEGMGSLYSAVADGALGSQTGAFYQHMLSNQSWGGLSTEINNASSSSGLSSAENAAFKGLIRVAYKDGNYTLPPNEHLTRFGWVSLPFAINGQVVHKQYIVGAFVNNGTSLNNASNATWSAIGRMMRDEINASAQSWQNASVSGAATAFGTGCSTLLGTLGHTADVPSVSGPAVNYRCSGVLPLQPAILSIGFSATNWAGIPLPFDLALIGAPGCKIYNDVFVSIGATANISGNAVVQIPFTLPELIGAELYTQFYALTSGVSPSGVATSNGIHSIIGM